MLPNGPAVFFDLYNKGMKITRYPQSCILIEKEGQKIVIDPGSPFLQTHQATELKDVAAVLYTHQHPDHYEPSIADTLYQGGTAIYANAATAKLIGEEKCTVVQDGDSFAVAGFDITARELPHCLLPDGSAGPQNTGYVVSGIFFHPGDGKELAGLQVAAMALPVVGPDISLKEAFVFAQQLGVKLAIPIHYDLMGADMNTYQRFAAASNLPFEFKVLADGESVEVAA